MDEHNVNFTSLKKKKKNINWENLQIFAVIFEIFLGLLPIGVDILLLIYIGPIFIFTIPIAMLIGIVLMWGWSLSMRDEFPDDSNESIYWDKEALISSAIIPGSALHMGKSAKKSIKKITDVEHWNTKV